MNEQAPQQPVDYLQEHPNAVEDQAKAKVMAYASRGQEEVVVAERAKALDAASNIGDRNYRGEENHPAASSAQRHAERAQNAREIANTQALGAASIYDQVKGL